MDKSEKAAVRFIVLLLMSGCVAYGINLVAGLGLSLIAFPVILIIFNSITRDVEEG